MQGFKIPKQIATGLFTDIVIPSVGQNGYGAKWNNATQKTEWGQFETYGSVVSGIATHVGLSNPHSQYPLSSSLGTAAYLNVGTSANNIVQLNGSGASITVTSNSVVIHIDSSISTLLKSNKHKYDIKFFDTSDNCYALAPSDWVINKIVTNEV